MQQNSMAPGFYLWSYLYGSGLQEAMSEAPAVVASLHLQRPEKDFALILSKLLLLEYRLCHGEMRIVRALGACAGGSQGWAQLKGLEGSARNRSQTLSLVMQTSNPESHHNTVNKVTTRHWY